MQRLDEAVGIVGATCPPAGFRVQGFEDEVDDQEEERLPIPMFHRSQCPVRIWKQIKQKSRTMGAGELGQLTPIKAAMNLSAVNWPLHQLAVVKTKTIVKQLPKPKYAHRGCKWAPKLRLEASLWIRQRSKRRRLPRRCDLFSRSLLSSRS